MTDQESLKTYRGNCHCGTYIFEAKLPEIKVARSCNCSICHKGGALWGMPEPGNLKFVKGDASTLTNYKFGKELFSFKFCATCGTTLLVVGYMEPPKPGEEKDPFTGVNLRTIQDLDIWSLETSKMDGAAIPPLYEPPNFTGKAPQVELEGGKISTGSCHCGAIRLALKTKPLDETYSDRVVECNCSICSRYGTTWIYPKNEFVAIEGRENITQYLMGQNIFCKGFCKICGVPIENKAADLTQEQLEAVPEAGRRWYEFGKHYWSVNARVLNGVDLELLKKERLDGWNNITPGYTNP
ncbi:glutathione-dependent formaldehyde-activating enzyme [Xylariales sp. AK1849]|nr:glutathione-dependent formaldehyde-activating enzyme [Xylariales sp. AK1849]